VITEPLGPCQPRVEILGIEIAVVDGVTGGRQPLDDRPVQTGVEAGFDRVGIEHEDFHRRPRRSARQRHTLVIVHSAFCNPLNRNDLPER
jgi:hypothetical protein